MKRILTISLLFFAMSMALHAQLPRNFYGVTLGVTTKQQAIKALLTQKVCIALNTENGLLLKNVEFEGQHFDNLQMNFYEDILSDMFFDDDKGTSNAKIEEVGERLTTKFSKFKYHFYTNADIFDDDVTKIVCVDDAIFINDMKMDDRKKRDSRKYYREIHPYTEPRISTTLLGCTLGTSTKQQVTAALKAKGLNVLPVDLGDGGATVVFEGTYHEGVSFDYIFAVFCDGKLATLSFAKANGNMSQYELDTLNRNIDSQYPAYNNRREYGFHEEGYAFDDDRIFIAYNVEGISYNYFELMQKVNRKKERSTRGVL